MAARYAARCGDPVLKALRVLAFSLTAAAWLFLVGAVVSTAQAAEATLGWNNATKNTDGSTIPATGPGSLLRTHVNYGTCINGTQFGTGIGVIVVPAPANTAVVSSLVAQTYCFVAKHENTFGEFSGNSNVVSKTITLPNPTPNPPTGLVVSATTAYVIKQTRDNIAVVAVGSVPADTACDSAKGVIAAGATYHVVPRERVTWAGTVQSEIVVARCS